VIFKSPNVVPWVLLAEMFFFVAILITGLAYVWVKKDLEWIKSIAEIKEDKVPLER
jgi:NADH-quinone oxidoreductase subunit A